MQRLETLSQLLLCVIIFCFCFFILALSLARDEKTLLKEVTTMLSVKHPNMMSFIGVCFDGEMPLIIMPYMSKGSVLEYVKQNKSVLLIDREINTEVCDSL